MTIIFDARYIRTDFHDGISRYAFELGRALAKRRDVTFLICNEKQREFLPRGAKTIMFHSPTSWKEPFSSLLLNDHHPDLLISPMQTIGMMGRTFKAILTLHDLIYYRHSLPPQNLPWAIRVGWRLYHASYWPQRVALNSADMVMTVSETSRAQIMAANLTKRPVFVATNAPQHLDTYLTTAIRRNTPPTNLVYMGSFMPYKNAETLIRGMADLPGYTLHLLSRISPERERELEKLIPAGGGAVIFHNGVTDQVYAQLLANNALLVTGSLDEGFGIPVAEGLALGTPGVISDIPIFHEVAGDGALYFSPEDPADFARAVKEASELETYQKLSERGKQNMERFSWEQSADNLDAAITELLGRA